MLLGNTLGAKTIFIIFRSPYIPSDSSVDSSDEKEKEIIFGTTSKVPDSSSSVPTSSQSEGVTVAEAAKKQSSIESLKSVDEPFPESQIPSPLNEEDFPKSQIPSPLDVDDIFKDVESSAAQLSSTDRGSSSTPSEPQVTEVTKVNVPKSAEAVVETETKKGPLSVCVVDGLYSVHSPKGHKVLVGVELSPRDKFPSESSKETKSVTSSPLKKKDIKLDSKDNKKLIQSAQKIKEPVPSPREGKNIKKLDSVDKSSPVRRQRTEEKLKDGSHIPHTRRVDTAKRSEEESKPSKTGDQRSTSSPNRAQLQHKVNIVGLTKKSTLETKIEIAQKIKIISDSSDESVHKPGTTHQIKRTYSFERDESETPIQKSTKNDDIAESIIQVSIEKPIVVVERESGDSVRRVPSYECTCELLDDASPEQECTCVSSQEVTEQPASSSKQTSSFKTAEIRKVVSPPTDSSSYHTNQDFTANQELLNTESIFSSEEEFKSGATSPFYSPRADSPEMTVAKHSKMDKEVRRLHIKKNGNRIQILSSHIIGPF